LLITNEQERYKLARLNRYMPRYEQSGIESQEDRVRNSIIEKADRGEAYTEEERDYIRAKAERLSEGARDGLQRLMNSNILHTVLTPGQLMKMLLTNTDEKNESLFNPPHKDAK